MVTPRHLWSIVNAALSCSTPPSPSKCLELQHALSASLHAFQSLIFYPALKASDRAQVQSKEVRLPNSPPFHLDNMDVLILHSHIPSATEPLTTGVPTKTPLKKTFGQKKPLKTGGTSSPFSSKKQKTSGAFLDQSIEQLNDMAAVSGVNIREGHVAIFDEQTFESSRGNVFSPSPLSPEPVDLCVNEVRKIIVEDSHYDLDDGTINLSVETLKYVGGIMSSHMEVSLLIP